MCSRMFLRDAVHDERLTMNAVPAARARWASWMSVVVFPRPAGPFEDYAPALRQLPVELLERQHVGRLLAVRIKPQGGKLDEWKPFRFLSPGLRDSIGRMLYSVVEFCDLRFGINIQIQKARTEGAVPRRHQSYDDFFTLEEQEIKVVVTPNLVCPLLSLVVAHFGGRDEEKLP